MNAQGTPLDLDAYNAVIRCDPGDVDLQIPASRIRGELPAALLGGAWYQNGPGLVELGGRLMHPLDGHGYVRALHIGPDGSARLRGRYVRTAAYEAERAAGAVTYRGIGSSPPGNWWARARAPAFKNVANTTVVPWAGRLLALWEGGLPHRLDPETLETLGVETFDGLLTPGTAVLAHTRIDRARGRLVLACPKMGRDTGVRLIELDESGASVATAEVTLPGITVMHDFVITERFYVLFVNPMALSPVGMWRYVTGRGGLMHLVAPSRAAAEIVLVPRGGGEALRFPLDRWLFAVHHVNAWDDGDDRVVLLSCTFDDFALGVEFGYRGPTEPLVPNPDAAGQVVSRVVLDLAGGSASRETFCAQPLDFPRVHPARDGLPVAHFVAASSLPLGRTDVFDAVTAVDLATRSLRTWGPRDGRLLGEPLLAPTGPDATGSFVLVAAYDGAAGSSSLLVLPFDALEAGPIAEIPMPLMPFGFHGWWRPPEGEGRAD